MFRNASVCLAGLVLLWSAATFADADLEVRKSVDTPIPSPGQPVEFTVRVSNIGVDPASDVVVHDLLPSELKIPAGMAPFASTGTYDPISGDWSVGDLARDADATLVIPAIVATTTPPACIVNRAEVADHPDQNDANNFATAAVRESPDTRCIDLSVDFSAPLFASPLACGEMHFDTIVDVVNAGPDAALDVTVNLQQDPELAPHLRFTGVLEPNTNVAVAECTDAECVIARLGTGETIRVTGPSDAIRLTTTQTQTLTLTVSSADRDYAPANNRLDRAVDIPAVQPCEGGVLVARCFIATAAFGSPLEQHVITLQHFRDQVLLQSGAGRSFVELYYRYSPPVADWIARHETARFVTRVLLTPMILAIAFPVQTSIILRLMVLVLWLALRRSLAVRSNR